MIMNFDLILNQISNNLLICLVSLMVQRFKRVEVQVVQDEKETTANLFQKLRYLKLYNIIFMVVFCIFQVPLLIYIYQKNTKLDAIRYKGYEPIWRDAILAMIVDIILIMFLFAKVMNMIIHLASIKRLIKFLSNKRIWIVLSYSIIFVLSLLFLN